MEERMEQAEALAILQERYELVIERIAQMAQESYEPQAMKAYFDKAAAFLLMLDETRRFLEQGGLEKASLEELQERNRALYEDVLPEQYETSFLNPTYAAETLGEYAQVLSWLFVRMRSCISYVYEGRLEELVISMELFTEVYASVYYEWKENGQLPKVEEIRKMLYWFMSDYAEIFAQGAISGMVCTKDCFAADIIRKSDLNDPRYLYAYGEYVTENEIEMAQYMAQLPQETINTMADTYTEGYRMGFELAHIDLSKKTTVGVYYHLGFERMLKRAFENFEKLGLMPAIARGENGGFGGASANRQYGYDHKDDMALILDKNYMTRSLEARRAAFELYKAEAAGYAGPAVVETFGEADFEPVNKKEAVRMSDEQNRLWVEFITQNRVITLEYIKQEERSFTIIAFPVPEVGEVFRELFDETIRLNTLDYMLYRRVQQTLIDVLDTADYCEVKGGGVNRTDLKVNLWKLQNPEKETIFENCVADVNIPVGEVFTSPVLEGTNGLLHVSKVFLNGLEYRDLALTFENGMITDYTCGNFETEEENRSFVKENILFRRETLPLGEFAIGTNTTAYVMAKRLGVEAKLPILIAEKCGPHFAVGDTCYSHAEDNKVYNPDGKEIVARDNEKSILRREKPQEAYFNCHTDITIPYDELEELTAVRKDGSRVILIQNGRFVLPGTEVLNEPFDAQ